MNKNTYKILGILFAVTLTTVALITVRNNRVETSSQVKIGAIFNMTGYGSFAGEESKNGLLLALKDNNFPIEQVVIEDGQSDLKSVVNAANKLIQVNRVQAIIGPEWTEFGSVAAPIGVKNKIPIISPWVVADSEFVKPPFFWSMTPSDLGEHREMAKYLKNNKTKNVAIIKTNNTWSDTNARQFKDQLSENGMAFSEITVTPNQMDFRSEALKIKGINPDIIYSVIADDAGHSAFCDQILTLMPYIDIATHSTRAKTQSTIEKLSTRRTHILFAEMNPGNKQKEFVQKYEKEFGRIPVGPSAAATYDAATILFKSIRSGKTTSANLITSIQNTNMDGYSGQVVFDSNGRLPIREASIFSFNKEGDIVRINTETN